MMPAPALEATLPSRPGTDRRPTQRRRLGDVQPLRVVLGSKAVTVHTDTLSTQDVLAEDLEQHRRALTGYCYRMLGSAFEADDAVQETMVRAWRGIDGFEGRSAVRSWLYRIATNVCLDMLRGRQRRARPMDLGPSSTADSFHGATRPEHVWVEPIPDARVLPEDGDPAELAASRETHPPGLRHGPAAPARRGSVRC